MLTAQDIFGNDACKVAYDWTPGGVPFFDVILSIPTGLFGIFLLWNLRSSLRKLKETDSLIMSTYYVFVWMVCIFNIIRLVVAFSLPNPKNVYNIIYIFVNFILIFIEVSVVIFMSHSYSITGREALERTAWMTALLASIYTIFQIILIFAFDIPLFRMTDQPAMLYWFISCLVLSIFYLTVLIIPHTPGQRFLPGINQRLYYYVGFLSFIYAIRSLGSLLSAFELYIGYCCIDASLLCYYSFFLPILYWSFLREFFHVPVLHPAYSEMVHQGYFDSDT